MTNVCNTFVYSDHIFYILTSICMYCILPLVFMSCHPGVIITIAVYILYISVTIACTGSRHPLCLKTVKLVLGLFLTKTKQNPFLPSNFDGKIWPHSTQLCLGFFSVSYFILGHSVLTSVPVHSIHMQQLLVHPCIPELPPWSPCCCCCT